MRTTAILMPLMFATPASAQCLVGQTGLSFEQWKQVCSSVVEDTCNAVPGGTDEANCRAIAEAMYQTYLASPYARPSSCGEDGAEMCINGWVSQCRDGQWMTTSSQC
jgi:hypothetical protein